MSIERLDRHLATHDVDDLTWADGVGATEATEMLAALEEGDWRELAACLGARPPRWRQCLASALCPGLGPLASAMLISLAFDPDESVAFEALQQVAFYCGVNAGAPSRMRETGADAGISPPVVEVGNSIIFTDERIVDEPLLTLARARAALPARARTIAADCDAHSGTLLRYLASRLESTGA